jgi:DNA-binding winged helix-turn-helix (wHTH) protein/tetratricopeptide (TPR) repeat protein
MPGTMTRVLYRFEGYQLDTAKRELRRGDVLVPLQARVFECLCHLIEHRDRAVDRDELGLATFGRHDVSDAQLGQIILRARRAVGDDGHEQRLIRTIPRYGFRWMARTQVVETTAGDEAQDDAASVAMPEAAAAEQVAPDATTDPPSHVAAVEAGLQDTAAAMPPSGSPGVAGRRWRWPALALLAACALLGLAAVLLVRRVHPEPAPPPPAVMVLPTVVEGPEETAWARLGLMAFVGERLRRVGLPVVPNETTLVLLSRGETGASGHARLRRAAGVDLIVESRLTRESGRWRMRLEAVDAQGIHQRAEAVHGDLLQAARIASDRLLAALGHPAPRGDTDLGLAERLQRAEAARLANRLDAAREILQSAPAAQRNSPELRYRLARVQIRAGDYDQAMRLLDALLREPGQLPAFRARLLSARGAVSMRLAKIEQAERDFDAAVRLLDPRTDAAELGSALTYRGVTRSGLGRFDAALADLGQARVHLLRSGDTLAVARVDGNLGVLELNRGRPAAAFEYLQRAAGVFESYGAVQELLITRSHLLQVHLMQLQYDRAWEASERNWAMRDRAGDPGQRLAIHLDRAEVLLRQGRFRQAQALLDTPAVAARDTTVNERRRALVRIELAWRNGEMAEAIRRADAVLAGWAEEPWDDTRGWVLLRRQQAALASGQAPHPLPAEPEPGTVIDPRIGTAPAPVPTLPGRLAQATALRAAGREAAADAGYLAALSLAEQRGIPAEIATTVAAYGPWLIERGRLAEAGALVGRVAPWADRDYDCALLQLRLYHALGQRELWASALATARSLAGDRRIPAELTRLGGA